ncbi:cell wall-binding repeat-containing protein [Desulfosporosinus sp. I2]|uniref:cell wall-binding repeat-containing protein n=1 Tax=Desulfosporosinus sp. I2 TaxID=1617025 RepID=UPI001FA73C80|nr:cell wall-binding repeat-containing protein [Desulfosporosinus sp. I2]
MRANQFRKIIAVLIIGLFFMKLIPAKSVLAADVPTVPTAYYEDIGKKLEFWANKYNIPPVLLKSIAWMESGWKQYELDSTGQPITDKPLIGRDGIGIGIMQISSYSASDTETINKLKNDIDYNIEMGCQMLNQKLACLSQDWRWRPQRFRKLVFCCVGSNNSWASRNNPNFLTGKSAYQDSIFSLMRQKYNSAITFTPETTKFSKELLPPVNPPYFSGRWSTPTPTHLGDLKIDPSSLISSGGGPGAEAANGDYWYNYARWGSYYALGFYVTAYKSPTVTDKSVISQKILKAYANLLAEADTLVLEKKDSSYTTAAKYYWTVLQGPNLDATILERASKGHLSALSKLITETDKLLLEGSGPTLTNVVQDYGVVLQGSTLDAGLAEQAKSGLIKAYGKLLAEADKLAVEGTATSKASAANYYLMVLQGLVLDASLTERAKIGYELTRTANSNPSPIYEPSRGSTPEPTPNPQPQPGTLSIQRLYGTRAEETAIKISKEGWADNSSPIVLLARVDRFQDALAAAPLAKKLKAPLLLTAPDKLDNLVLQEMKRLGAGGTVYVIGGDGAIKKTVTDALAKANLPFERLFGKTAADTAAEIARKMGPSKQVILASGSSFPDALSASAPAAALGIPILLTEQGTLPAATTQLLKDYGVTKTIIVGGKYAVSTSFDAKGGPLDSYGPLRLAGETKYDTMLQIVKYFNQDTKSIVIATGENFPDGLSGGAFSALSGSPMILVPKGAMNSDTQAFLKSLSGKATKTYILGGTGVISSSNEKILGSLLTPE